MENEYTVTNGLSQDELERIRSLEEQLTRKHRKNIALVAYEKANEEDERDERLSASSLDQLES